jgi:hypothetical protein
MHASKNEFLFRLGLTALAAEPLPALKKRIFAADRVQDFFVSTGQPETGWSPTRACGQQCFL